MPRGVYERKPFMRSVKVTAKMKVEMLAALAKGKSVAQVAARFKVNRITVWRLNAVHAKNLQANG